MAEAVADHLAQNPDFLLNRPELFAILTPPSHRRGDNVVDMQRFMIESLQREMTRGREAQDALVQAGRRHRIRQSRVHRAALDIIAAASFQDVIQVLTTDLAMHLEVDAVALCVEADGDAPVRAPSAMGGIHMLAPGTVSDMMGGERAVLLRPSLAPEPAIYGAAASLVASDALLRLEIGPRSPIGLVALGAREDGRFDESQGTEPFRFLARIIAITIGTWLDLPA